jgi:choline dehydrogenase-like flavoprotein
VVIASTASAVPQRCEVIIVGAGLAGLEIASELEERGVSDVVILDAGPAHDLRHVNCAHDSEDALRRWLEPSTDEYFRRPWVSKTPPHYDGLSGVRRRVGGRSLYWYGVVLPIEPWALAPPGWPANIVSDLRESWNGDESLYERVQSRLRNWSGSESLLRPGDPLIALGGYPLRPAPRAVRRCGHGSARWFAYSALDHWRDPESGRFHRRSAGIRLYPDVEVLDIVVRDRVARGAMIRRNGDPDAVEIEAPIVVLSAGTLENSRLAVQALTPVGGLREPRLPGLADHIVQGVFLQLKPDRASRLLSVLPPGTYYAPCEDAARSNLFLEVRLMGDAVLFDLQLTGEQLPSESSWVACEPSRDGAWAVSVEAGTSPEDLEVIAAQQGILQTTFDDLAAAAGVPTTTLEFADYNRPMRDNAFVLPESLPPGGTGAPVTWCNCLGSEDHEGCTLPLGGLLDDGHELGAVRGLFAAGPSTFPRLGAANPALTTLALAHRLAGRIAGLAPVDQAGRPSAACGR